MSRTTIYREGDNFWLGMLVEHPEIMTQEEALGDLEEDIKDTYRSMVTEDVLEDHETRVVLM